MEEKPDLPTFTKQQIVYYPDCDRVKYGLYLEQVTVLSIKNPIIIGSPEVIWSHGDISYYESKEIVRKANTLSSNKMYLPRKLKLTIDECIPILEEMKNTFIKDINKTKKNHIESVEDLKQMVIEEEKDLKESLKDWNKKLNYLSRLDIHSKLTQYGLI